MKDDKGGIRAIRTQGYWVPKVKTRLLSTNAFMQMYKDERITGNHKGITLSGSTTDPTRTPVTAPIDARTNLPTTLMRRTLTHLDRSQVKACISLVQEANINLSEPVKELLRWHYRLGHVNFKKIQFLQSTGVLAITQAMRVLHKRCCNMREIPKCTACQYAKQTLRNVPGAIKHVVKDKVGILKADHVHPGDCVSVDHFITPTKGRLFTSRGKSQKDLYAGVCVFVDHASGMQHVVFQAFLTSHETWRLWLTMSNIVCNMESSTRCMSQTMEEPSPQASSKLILNTSSNDLSLSPRSTSSQCHC